ncbi:MAG: response regulator [Actinobacteria bacterium]|nr:response regulator [Actinomycetota bacterium]
MAGKRILVVEDTELLRRMYRDRLSQDGYQVSEAADGLAALSLLRDESFDVILLDLIMPRMGGIQVLEAVRKDPRTQSIPVIVLTNLGEESTIEQAVSLGAVDYLIKNETRPADVSDKVGMVLEAYSVTTEGADTFTVYPDPSRGDVDALVHHADLKRRLWCPACENELALEMVPDAKRAGWYSARFICPTCGRTFSGSA